MMKRFKALSLLLIGGFLVCGLFNMKYSFTINAEATDNEITSRSNIVDKSFYYIKGVRSSSTYYLKFIDSISASVSGTESSTKDGAIAIQFIKVSENVWNLKTPNGYYVAPYSSNGKLVISSSAINVSATDVSSKIRLSVSYSGTQWSLQKNTDGSNFGGYKNTQSDITLIEKVLDKQLASIESIEGSLSASVGETKWNLSSLTPKGKLSDSSDIVDISSYVELSTSDIPGNVSTTKNVPVTVTPYTAGTVTAKTINVTGTVSLPEEGTSQYNPYTVEHALAAIGDVTLENKFVKGYVIDIGEYKSAYKSLTYTIADSVSSTEGLLVYSGKNLNNTDFTSADQLKIGDLLIVTGNLKNYEGTKEFDKNNYIVSLKSEARVTLNKEEIDIAIGETDSSSIYATPINFEGTGDYTYNISSGEGSNIATIIANGSTNVLTIVGNSIGSHTYTISVSRGHDTATATLKVNVVADYPVSMGRNGYINYTDTQKFSDAAGSLLVTYKTGAVTTFDIEDEGVNLIIDDQIVNPNECVKNYIGKQAYFSYTEGDVTVYTSKYTLNIKVELSIDSIDDLPEYLLVGEEETTATINYTSLNGKPSDFSISSSDSTKLTVNYDEELNVFDGDTKKGQALIGLTGLSAGQFNILVSATFGSRTETKSYPVIVRTAAPQPTEGYYKRITSTSELTNGSYIIGTKDKDGNYFAANSGTGKSLSATNITVDTSGKITSEVDGLFVFTLSRNNNNVSVNNGTNYISGKSGKTDLEMSSTLVNWTLNSGIKNTINLVSQTDTARGLIAQKNSTSASFKHYAISNLKNENDYYDLELFKYYENSASGFDLVNIFVKNNMKMDTISTLNVSDTGACRGESGYYLTAKKAYNKMISDYKGTEILKDIFQNQFADAYARYCAWAIANNDAAPFDGNDSIVTPIHASNLFNGLGDNASKIIPVIISSITILGAASFGIILMLKHKKKEN